MSFTSLMFNFCDFNSDYRGLYARPKIRSIEQISKEIKQTGEDDIDDIVHQDLPTVKDMWNLPCITFPIQYYDLNITIHKNSKTNLLPSSAQLKLQ